MWRLSLAIRLIEALTMRQQERMAALNIDDDVALALRVLRKAAAKVL
jgi:BarA-like signal transduction histidine kinase